jgi:hypothetical protein
MAAISGRDRTKRIKIQNHVTSRTGNDKLSKLRKPYWDDEDYFEHQLDGYLLDRLSTHKKCEGMADELLGPDFDGINGVLHMQWTDNDIKTLWEKIFQQSMSILRYADPKGASFIEELEWIGTNNFEAVCYSMQLDPFIIRSALPRVIGNYHKGLVGRAKDMLTEFDKISENMSSNLTEHERLVDFRYKGEVKLLNEHTFADAEKLKQKNVKIKAAASQIAKKDRSTKPKDPFYGKSAGTVQNELNNSFLFFDETNNSEL